MRRICPASDLYSSPCIVQQRGCRDMDNLEMLLAVVFRLLAGQLDRVLINSARNITVYFSLGKVEVSMRQMEG